MPYPHAYSPPERRDGLKLRRRGIRDGATTLPRCPLPRSSSAQRGEAAAMRTTVSRIPLIDTHQIIAATLVEIARSVLTYELGVPTLLLVAWSSAAVRSRLDAVRCPTDSGRAGCRNGSAWPSTSADIAHVCIQTQCHRAGAWPAMSGHAPRQIRLPRALNHYPVRAQTCSIRKALRPDVFSG